MARPRSLDPTMDASYQRYLLLSNKQESLRRRISPMSPSSVPTTASPLEPFVFPMSPTFNRSSFSSFSASPPSSMPALPCPVLPIAYFNNMDDQHTEDRDKLHETNQQIKAVLTELLNKASVKSDGRFRSQLQRRLMEVEIEMRKQRRRRSSVDPDIARSIGSHFEHGSSRFSP